MTMYSDICYSRCHSWAIFLYPLSFSSDLVRVTTANGTRNPGMSKWAMSKPYYQLKRHLGRIKLLQTLSWHPKYGKSKLVIEVLETQKTILLFLKSHKMQIKSSTREARPWCNVETFCTGSKGHQHEVVNIIFFFIASLTHFKYCRSTNVRALLIFANFAVWSKTRTLIAREHFLQLLYPIYRLPKSWTLIAGEMLWFTKTWTFIAANISWSAVHVVLFLSAWLRGDHDFDPSGAAGYIAECNRVGCIPASYFIRHIQDHDFIMRNHGLGPLGAKAISKPLEVSLGTHNIVACHYMQGAPSYGGVRTWRA